MIQYFPIQLCSLPVLFGVDFIFSLLVNWPKNLKFPCKTPMTITPCELFKDKT